MVSAGMSQRRSPAVAWEACVRSLVSARYFVLLAVTVLALGAVQPPRVVLSASNGTQLISVNVELARTPGQREFGLMYRAHLDEDAGMLFIFPAAEPLKFWMKHTEIPLDMIFADSSAVVVGIVANATPYSERPIGPDTPALYVLEVNGGFCARHGVHNGDRMSFVGFEPRTSQ